MFRRMNLYPCSALLAAIICLILLSSFGCGGNSGIVPDSGITPTQNPVSYTLPTPTPVLTNKPVSGYIYANDTVTEDGETIPGINILDVPAYQTDESGNEPFVSQFSNSLKENYPEDWASLEIQELYTQLNKTLSESKPLTEYNAQAQVYSVYNDTSIPVSNDGHFDNSVLTDAEDSNVKLEVALGEDNYAEVETIPSSETINSSDAINAVLKSCPEKIFAFPGEIVIFKVYSEPGINLKSAGLRFTLNNSSIGCITQPVYLCIFGAHKYQVAYGCLYIKNGLNTPVDTTINAKTNNGLTLNIFTEVIKKTSSISGTVYTGGMPLVKGYVKSLGPKACCKIDASGAYSLPKVFMGHYRKVVATWWTEVNGQKVRHREEKIIDFFSQDMTGFNFGVPPTPTPTFTPSATPTQRPAGDPFYGTQTLKANNQFLEWRKELSIEDASKKTVDWLNNNLHESSIPNIPEGIKGAISCDGFGPNPLILVLFNDGYSYGFATSDDWFGSYPNNNNVVITGDNMTPQPEQNTFNRNSDLEAAEIDYFKPSNILILSPFEWQALLPKNIGTDDIVNNLKIEKYEVCSKITHISDFKVIKDDDIYSNINAYHISVTSTENIPMPDDYENMENYGLIYIYTHGSITGIVACPIIEMEDGTKSPIQSFEDDDDDMHEQFNGSTGDWFEQWVPMTFFDPNWPAPLDNNKLNQMKVLILTRNFFAHKNNLDKYNDSVIYLNSCESAIHHDIFSSAEIYLGNSKPADIWWEKSMGYYFFYYMMYGIMAPVEVPVRENFTLPPAPAVTPNQPMHARQAVDILSLYGVNPDPQDYYGWKNLGSGRPVRFKLDKSDCKLEVFPAVPFDDVYFPAPVDIWISK